MTADSAPFKADSPATAQKGSPSEVSPDQDANRRRDFLDKLSLAVIDKVVLGLIALGFGLWIQSYLEETEKIKDTILSVSKVNTELVSEQRKRLISSMAHFTQKFDSLRGVRSVDPQSIELLRGHSEDIKNSLSQMVILEHEIIQPVAAKLNIEIDLILEELDSRTMSDSEIEEKLKELHKEYKSTLDAVRDVSVRAVEKDREAVLKHFKSRASTANESAVIAKAIK